jgi:hypothetical protein
VIVFWNFRQPDNILTSIEGAVLGGAPLGTDRILTLPSNIRLAGTKTVQLITKNMLITRKCVLKAFALWPVL